MALPAPDMEDCCKKERCLFGPNAGQVYSTCDPCPVNYEFSEEECDCIPTLPSGRVEYRIVDGNMTVGGIAGDCDNDPSPWIYATPVPYIDNEGRLVQFSITPVANWGCNYVVLEYENCNEWENFATDYKVTKINGCGGGGSMLIYGQLNTFLDGEFSSSEVTFFFQLHTSCETPEGWTGDPYKSTHCATHYEVGKEWTATVEWRQSDGEGGYIPV